MDFAGVFKSNFGNFNTEVNENGENILHHRLEKIDEYSDKEGQLEVRYNRVPGSQIVRIKLDDRDQLERFEIVKQ